MVETEVCDDLMWWTHFGMMCVVMTAESVLTVQRIQLIEWSGENSCLARDIFGTQTYHDVLFGVVLSCNMHM